MKVLIFTGWYPNPIYVEDGLSVRNQALMLQGAGLDVSVVSVSLTGQWLAKGLLFWRRRATNYHGVREFRLEGPFLKKRIEWLWRRYNAAAERMLFSIIEKEGRPDIIHLHNHMVGPAALRVSQMLDIKLVYTEHSTAFMRGDLPTAQRLFMFRLVEHAYAAGVSKALAKSMARQTSTSVDVLPNFIDTDIFYNTERDTTHSGIHLITVSVLIPRKQVDLLLTAFAKLVATREEDLTLTIVGYGPEKEALRQLSRRLGLSDKVQFTGALDQWQVAEALRSADIFVSASKLETFGVMYAEALACGLPVVALDSGGVRDVVYDSQLGHIADDMDHFYDLLVDVITRFHDYSRQEIARLTIQQFGKDAIVDQHKRLYESLLSS